MSDKEEFTWEGLSGQQHDTGRVSYKNGGYFASTASPEDAKRIADALNSERELAEQTKHRKINHELIKLHHADAMELWKALSDLSFECYGVTQTDRPSLGTYNETFGILQKHRIAYSEDARSSYQVALTDTKE